MSDQQLPDDLTPLKELAARHDIPEQTLYGWARKGFIPRYRLRAHRILLSEADVLGMLVPRLDNRQGK